MEVTPELAELFGAYVGDGTMSARRDGRPSLAITASKDEKEWLEHIANLFEQIFHYGIKVRWDLNAYKIHVRTGKICEFFKKAGFPVGKKSLTVKAPQAVIKASDEVIYKAFLKGYFDADGSLTFERKPHGGRTEFKGIYHYYPRVALTSISKELILTDVKQMLEAVGLRYNTCERAPSKKGKNKVYIIVIAGAPQLEFWMKEVKSSNPVYLSKYYVWKKFGFCPPRVTLEQKLAILSGELDPEIFYNQPSLFDKAASMPEVVTFPP